MMKAAFGTLLALTMLLVTWAMLPSRLFFDPTAVTIEGTHVTVARTAPLVHIFGEPFIRYVEVVRNAKGMACDTNNLNGYRYKTSLPVGSWALGDWAAPCMDERPFVWTAQWQVMLFDMIPLRPVSLTTVVE